MASNDAKSYIETVMARADGATEGPWDNYYGGRQTVHTKVKPLSISAIHIKVAACLNEKNKHRDGDFIAHARQDIPTLGKIALAMIEVLKAMADETVSEWECKQVAQHTLVRINALAAKGSQ